ncbi:MAG: tetratricopeptide repeat protein [Ignavibacteriaceae bacterium]|nr:tetratricopeptide repeat protein [Ignavibacteriaceae bacterium]
MIHLFREEKFLKIISTAIVITSGLFGIIGLLEVFEIKVIPLPTIIPPGSTLGHRSFAAEYLLPALPFFLIAKELIKKDYYPLLIISAFINLSFILFTRSRSAILALGIIASLYFIYFFIQRKKEIKKLLPIAAVVLLAFIFSLLPAKGGERTDLKETAESLLDTKFKSNRLRITFWDASLKMISENFFTGVGLYKWSGTYPKYYGKEFNDQNVIKVHSIHAHSDFLELFAENGFFAPLFYLLLLLTILIILYSRSKNNQLYFYIFISVLATGIFSLVAFPFYKFSSHFLLSVGTGIALHSKNVNSSKAINVSLKKLMWFLGILLLITSITSILKMKSEFDFIRSVQYLRVKNYSMMNQELEKISNVLFPFDASKQPVDYYRGIANYYLGNNDVAMKSNLDAEKVAPYNPIVLQNIAGSYQSLGNYKKSVEMFERVKKLFPHYINPQINLIHAYLQIGEFEKSRKLFESIKKKEPNHPRLQEFRDKFHPE